MLTILGRRRLVKKIQNPDWQVDKIRTHLLFPPPPSAAGKPNFLGQNMLAILEITMIL